MLLNDNIIFVLQNIALIYWLYCENLQMLNFFLD